MSLVLVLLTASQIHNVQAMEDIEPRSYMDANAVNLEI